MSYTQEELAAYWEKRERKAFAVPVYAFDSVRDLPSMDAHGNRIGKGDYADMHVYHVIANNKEAAASFAKQLARVHCLRGHRLYFAWGTEYAGPVQA